MRERWASRGLLNRFRWKLRSAEEERGSRVKYTTKMYKRILEVEILGTKKCHPEVALFVNLFSFFFLMCTAPFR